MKVVILAGGYGTRLSEETGVRPKPLVEIGGQPILWHIMKIYSAHGLNDFVICCGYKGYLIKEYFANYFLHTSDVTFDVQNNEMEVHRRSAEPWRVTLVDTGRDTMTGGRIGRVREHLDNAPFCLTYGDGVSDIDVTAEIEFHRSQSAWITLTAVQPPGRFGTFELKDGQNKIHSFHEKPDGDGAWINGGFFVCEPEALDLIDGDDTIWEREPMQRAAHKGRMAAYRHTGFWHPMDTLRDRQYLENLWADSPAPWQVWD